MSSDELELYRIKNLPASFYYIPNFLSASEATALLDKIPPNRWTHLSRRRLQAHPSTLTADNVLLSAPLPPWLTSPVVPRFHELGVFEGTKHGAPNHVLVNEYAPGQGIMPHEDGAAYEPVVATVSLGSALVLDLYAKEEGSKKGDRITRILQETGSLLVTKGEAYEVLLHGIDDIEVDKNLGPDTVANWENLGDKTPFEGGENTRGMRISLTYRDVIKVSKVGLGILGRRP